MTPKELKVIQKVARALSGRYTFGYYDKEDIQQECFLIAVEALTDYDETKGTLENFLYTHLNNRLKNFLRKHYYRKTFTCVYCGGNDPTCESCERRRWRFAIKKNLMEPIDIDNVNCNAEPNAYEYQNLHEQLELEEIFTIINKHLEVHLRADYLRMLEGLHVPKPKREVIENRILEILEEYGYERE
jgi:DNA-directed RNA polymerase specialized sigma24 family protein